MTLHWLKCYGMERTVAGPWRVGCLSGLRTTVKRVAANIGSLKNTRLFLVISRRAIFIHTPVKPEFPMLRHRQIQEVLQGHG
jgi:hypothetical protein